MLETLENLHGDLSEISFTLDCCVNRLNDLLFELETPKDQEMIAVFLAALSHINKNLHEVPNTIDRLLIQEHKQRKTDAHASSLS